MRQAGYFGMPMVIVLGILLTAAVGGAFYIQSRVPARSWSLTLGVFPYNSGVTALAPSPLARARDAQISGPPSKDSAHDKDIRMATQSASPDDGCRRRLSSVLRQLLAAPDAQAFAAQHGLYFEAGRVRVEIETRATDESLSARYDLRIEARADTILQALAPVGVLCDLSTDPSVLSVRQPLPAHPD